MRYFILIVGMATATPGTIARADGPAGPAPASKAISDPNTTIVPLQPYTAQVVGPVEAPAMGPLQAPIAGPQEMPAPDQTCSPSCARAKRGLFIGHGHERSGGCCAKIIAWFHYHRTPGKTLPCCKPMPYLPRLHNWFPCQEKCGAPCGTGCGASGCGGPPIVYYYDPLKGGLPTTNPGTAPAAPLAPAPEPTPVPVPRKELRGTPSGDMPTAAKRSATIPGFRFASAESLSIGSKKAPVAAPEVTPTMPVSAEVAPAGARPGESSFGFYPTSFKRTPNLP